MAAKEDIRQEPGEPFSRISPLYAKQMIEDGNVEVIDVRNPDEYAGGHIPGAKLIPVDDFFSRTEELDTSKRHVFVCSMGVRSALACEIAAAAGLDELYNIEGGTDAWAENGLPIET